MGCGHGCGLALLSREYGLLVVPRIEGSSQDTGFRSRRVAKKARAVIRYLYVG